MRSSSNLYSYTFLLVHCKLEHILPDKVSSVSTIDIIDKNTAPMFALSKTWRQLYYYKLWHVAAGTASKSVHAHNDKCSIDSVLPTESSSPLLDQVWLRKIILVVFRESKFSQEIKWTTTTNSVKISGTWGHSIVNEQAGSILSLLYLLYITKGQIKITPNRLTLNRMVSITP